MNRATNTDDLRLDRRFLPPYLNPLEVKGKLWELTKTLVKLEIEHAFPGYTITNATLQMDYDSPLQRLIVERNDYTVEIHHVYEVTLCGWGDFSWKNSSSSGVYKSDGFSVRYILIDMDRLFGKDQGSLSLQRITLRTGRCGNSSTSHHHLHWLRNQHYDLKYPFPISSEEMEGTVLLLQAGRALSDQDNRPTVYLKTVTADDYSNHVEGRKVISETHFTSFDELIEGVVRCKLTQSAMMEGIEGKQFRYEAEKEYHRVW